MKLGIGIDTGGTYTDAVIYDFDTQAVLGAAKALTTREDLSVGILGALDQLDLGLLRQASVIALSTTLATNACVEDKGDRAKLIFFGGDPKVIDGHGGKYGLPRSEDILIPPCRTDFHGGVEEEPDWEKFRETIRDSCQGLDGVGILEMNAMRNGAVVEKKAKAVFQKEVDIPVVCGHELFSQLNCLQRGASTLLNASLFPVIQDFLTAIRKALAVRDIHAPLVIVRSDGSLMSEAFAHQRPVETLLCGPAASTLGGTRLAKRKNAIVIDMGGTTTDIALVRDGLPVTALDGVSIGRWKTFVDGLYIKTFGLGGDSAIHWKDGQLVLEPYRVTPLSVAASKYPAVRESLKKLLQKKRRHTRFLHQHYLLARDVSQDAGYTEEELAICRALADGPLSMEDTAQAVGTDIYNLRLERLVRDGAVQVCGLTPTDLMHLSGDFTAYDREAAELAAEFAAFQLNTDAEGLSAMVFREMKRKIYQNVVQVLLEHQLPRYRKDGVGPEAEYFIDRCFDAAWDGTPDPLLSMTLKTEYALVGLGAPMGVFLEDVARLLGTEAILPDHYQVANALGAIMGNVSASWDVEIQLRTQEDDSACYLAYGASETRSFETLEEAEAFAREDAMAAARQEAIRRGAKGEVTVTCTVDHNNAAVLGGTVYLGTTVTAAAVGSLGY